MNKSTPNSSSRPSLEQFPIRQKLIARSRKYPEGQGKGTRLHTIWICMRSRCCHPSCKAYQHYGGRGITICDEWRDDFMTFSKWSKSNGYTEKLSIDRKDNDLGYSPENCRWATRIEQANNTRTNAYITAWGETKSAAEWARDPRCQVSAHTLQIRNRKKMDPIQAITQKERVTYPTSLTAWGETKTLEQWSFDPRCLVSLRTLSSRYKMDRPVEWMLTHRGTRKHEKKRRQ